MTPQLIFISFLIYSILLFIISYFTSKKANNDSFFSGNHVSPWWVVAYGMIGTSLSGVTFISVPGSVAKDGFSYLIMVLGYFLGYLFIIKILLPLYYKLNLTSIYTYFFTRFGLITYKSGASYFLLSRFIGSAFRMYLVVSILQVFVFNAWGIPFWVTTGSFILLILAYTFKAGIKTIVWTDTLQTSFMLASLIITFYIITNYLGITFKDLFTEIIDSDYSDTIITDWKHPKNYLKQFVAGAFMSIVMTGMDQDMMQKNLTCKNLKDSQKNMFWMSILLIPINLIFLFLGGALYIYAAKLGIILPEKADTVFPFLAFNHLGPIAGITFIIGLIAAAYSSADGAMTALTTSFSVDILNLNSSEKYLKKDKEKIRKIVHLGVAFTLFLLIVIFGNLNKESIINELFKIAGYTYGPILGLFSFGIFTKFIVKDKLVLPVVLLSPIISFFLDYFSEILFWGYKFGFELLLINGLITFIGLFIIRKNNES
jgi:solute:Na+ symporter, SSS family